ncbi:unnamed protein product [Lampetra planeri]
MDAKSTAALGGDATKKNFEFRTTQAGRCQERDVRQRPSCLADARAPARVSNARRRAVKSSLCQAKDADGRDEGGAVTVEELKRAEAAAVLTPALLKKKVFRRLVGNQLSGPPHMRGQPFLQC